MTKEREIIKDNADSEMVEEKIRRLPAGGEGWDKKMKRKRSVGAVSSRSNDNDGEMKRNMNNKLSVESGLLPGDSCHGFRLASLLPLFTELSRHYLLLQSFCCLMLSLTSCLIQSMCFSTFDPYVMHILFFSMTHLNLFL